MSWPSILSLKELTAEQLIRRSLFQVLRARSTSIAASNGCPFRVGGARSTSIAACVPPYAMRAMVQAHLSQRVQVLVLTLIKE